MPQRKHKPAQPVAVDRKPKPPLAHEWKSKGLVHRVQDGLKTRLIEMLDRFLPNAHPEEAYFLLAVLSEREADGGDRKSRGEYAVPLLSAIENVTSGDNYRRVVLLKDSDMLAPVEQFIKSLEKTVESSPKALAEQQPKPRQPSEIRAMREKDLKYFAEEFAQRATTDDLFFLESVLERWIVYLDYDEQDRPTSPIMSAFQYEVDGQSWLIEAHYQTAARAGALIRMLEQESWMSDLLNYIAEKGVENLSPCLIASKAAGMQEAWDKAREAA